MQVRESEANKKTSEKSSVSCVSPLNGAELVPGNPGNSGGKKGRSGRKPNEYHAFLRSSLDSEKARKAVETVLDDPNHAAYASVLGKIIPHAHGLPTQHIEVSSKLLLVDDIEQLEGADDDR